MAIHKKKLWIWGAVSFVLLVPALFLNLGDNRFIEDEGTRGIVAMEMIYQNDFITPTISGEYYYNKPPGYNWIIAVISGWFVVIVLPANGRDRKSVV